MEMLFYSGSRADENEALASVSTSYTLNDLYYQRKFTRRRTEQSPEDKLLPGIVRARKTGRAERI